MPHWNFGIMGLIAEIGYQPYRSNFPGLRKIVVAPHTNFKAECQQHNPSAFAAHLYS